jgi:hypothetical protein
MIQSRYRTLAVGCVTGLLAASLVGSAAWAGTETGGVTSYGNGVTVDSHGRVSYGVDLSELPGAVTTFEQGVRTERGTCSFRTDERGRAGTPSVLIVTELSFDPNTCTRELARAEYDRGEIPASVRAKLAKDPDTTTDSVSSTDDSGFGAMATWSGSLKVNVEDPPQIDVTTTRSNITWTSGGSAWQSSHWGWYSPSGWSRQSYDHNFYDGITYGSVNTTAHYRNGIFCLTIDTHTYHNQTYFRGEFDGGWYWSYDVDKSGGCTALLHYEYIADTP